MGGFTEIFGFGIRVPSDLLNSEVGQLLNVSEAVRAAGGVWWDTVA